MLSILFAVPSCFNSFWHGVIPTSYFIFNDFYTCVISVSKGISFKLLMGFPPPPNCESAGFCGVAKSLLGGMQLSLEAVIINAKSFTMTASVGNLNLGSDVVLERAGLQIEAGQSPSVGIVGNLKLKNPA